MELEASEDEEEIVAKEEEEVFSLEESGILPKHIEELEDKCSGKGGAKKNQKRKTGWGTILRAPQPRRVPEDGRTVVEKAQDLKKAKNLEKGCAMDRDEVRVDNGGKDDKKMGADAEVGGGTTSGSFSKSSGERSVVAAADRVDCPGEFVIRVGTIGCFAFGPQRCEFGASI